LALRKKNTELEIRVKELEEELEEWKQRAKIYLDGIIIIYIICTIIKLICKHCKNMILIQIAEKEKLLKLWLDRGEELETTMQNMSNNVSTMEDDGLSKLKVMQSLQYSPN
jgi:hypothetical protein